MENVPREALKVSMSALATCRILTVAKRPEISVDLLKQCSNISIRPDNCVTLLDALNYSTKLSFVIYCQLKKSHKFEKFCSQVCVLL